MKIWVVSTFVIICSTFSNAKAIDADLLNYSHRMLISRLTFNQIAKGSPDAASNYLRAVSNIVGATLGQFDVQSGFLAGLETPNIWSILIQQSFAENAPLPTLDDDPNAPNDPSKKRVGPTGQTPPGGPPAPPLVPPTGPPTYSKQCIYAGYILDRREGDTCNRAGILKEDTGFKKVLSLLGLTGVEGCGSQAPCNPAIYGLEKSNSGFKAICVGKQASTGSPESLTQQCSDKSKQEQFDNLTGLMKKNNIGLGKLFDLVNGAADKARELCIGNSGSAPVLIVRNKKDTRETCKSMIQSLVKAKEALKNDPKLKVDFTKSEREENGTRFIEKKNLPASDKPAAR